MALVRPWALTVCLCVSGTCSCGSCSRSIRGAPAVPREGLAHPPALGAHSSRGACASRSGLCGLPAAAGAVCSLRVTPGRRSDAPSGLASVTSGTNPRVKLKEAFRALVPRSATSQEPRVWQVTRFLGVPARRVGGCWRRALGRQGKGCSGPSAFMALTHQVGPPSLWPRWPRGAGSGQCPASGAGIFLGTWGTEGGRPGPGPSPMRALVRRGAGKVGLLASSDPCLPCQGSPGIRICLWLGLLRGRTGLGAAWDGSGCLGVLLGHSAWKLWSGRGGPPSLPCRVPVRF